MTSLGVSGIGHEFWIDDTPGGDRITALVAFLLALDDRPCELPGEGIPVRRVRPPGDRSVRRRPGVGHRRFHSGQGFLRKEPTRRRVGRVHFSSDGRAGGE